MHVHADTDTRTGARTPGWGYTHAYLVEQLTYRRQPHHRVQCKVPAPEPPVSTARLAHSERPLRDEYPPTPFLPRAYPLRDEHPRLPLACMYSVPGQY
jgi:hypothetical protein